MSVQIALNINNIKGIKYKTWGFGKKLRLF